MNNLQKDHLTQLMTALVREKDVYRQLLELAAEKKDVLVKNDIDTLNEIVKKEIESLNRLKALERKRSQAFTAACDSACCEAGKISDFIERLEGEDKTKLEAIVREFSGILDNLQQANQLNQKLLETHLKFTEVNIQYLSGEQELTYRSTGRITPEPARTIIDQKV